MKGKHLIFIAIIISLLFALFMSPLKYNLLGYPQPGKLNLTLIPEKNSVTGR